MITEWAEKFNSFNSMKGLLYKQWFDAILEGKFLPPIEASVDPANVCNLDCIWCNGADVKERNVLMTTEHLLDLMRFFKTWGVKGVCFAGGGEPTMHKDLDKAIDLCGELGLPVAIITNGTFTNDILTGSLARWCRWIGVSVDAANGITYKKLKGTNLFDRVIQNIKYLVDSGAREVTFKFLLHPNNQQEVYKAIELARDLGCQRIHIRPVSYMNYQDHEEAYDIDAINVQVLRAREKIENKNFKIFYIQHKFNNELHRKFEFKKCLATPIMPIFHASGDISICIDRKADKSLVIGSHANIEDIPKIWGSDKHKEVINNVKLSDCKKCTFNLYNEIIEKAIIQDSMDWIFT